MDLQIAGGSFGCLQQIIQQLFQLPGLTQQHLSILRYMLFSLLCSLCTGTVSGILRITGHFFSDEIRIIDNGSQRGLDVMGHICDQLRLQMFTLHPLLHGCGNSLADTVQILSVFLEGQYHMGGIQLMIQISVRQCFTALLQFFAHQCHKSNRTAQNKFLYGPEKE